MWVPIYTSQYVFSNVKSHYVFKTMTARLYTMNVHLLPFHKYWNNMGRNVNFITVIQIIFKVMYSNKLIVVEQTK